MTIQNKRRLTATLTLVATAKCGKGSCGLFKGQYRGILEVNGYSFEDDDGNAIGLAAFVMNVGKLNIVSPSYPAGVLNMMASRADLTSSVQRVSESHNVKQHYEGWFLKRTWTALKVAHGSKRQRRDIVDKWNSDLLPPIVVRIPVEHRVNLRLLPGVFDEDGLPMTPAQHARFVRSQRMPGAHIS